MAAKKLTVEDFYKKLSKTDKDFYVVATAKTKQVDLLPTGSWVINSLIGDGSGEDKLKGGGIPRGSVVEINGDESAGKSTLGMSICKEVQASGGLPVYIDYERTWSDWYATKLGIDVDPRKIIRISPDYFEQGARQMCDTLVLEPSVIVIDSVAAMTPKDFLEGEAEDPMRVGLHAQLMSRFLSIITKKLKRTNTTLILINQMRSLIKGKYDRGPSIESTGGKAIRYYAMIRLAMETMQVERIASKSIITGKDDKKAVNVRVNVKVIKNKHDKPHRAGPVIIRFGEGFDNVMSVAELAIQSGIIKQNGAFFTYTDGPKELLKAQGKESLRRKLLEDETIFENIKNRTSVKVDESLKDQSEKEDISAEGQETPDSGEIDDIEAALGETSKKFKGSK